jgi:hypothetical protein
LVRVAAGHGQPGIERRGIAGARVAVRHEQAL